MQFMFRVVTTGSTCVHELKSFVSKSIYTRTIPFRFSMPAKVTRSKVEISRRWEERAWNLQGAPTTIDPTTRDQRNSVTFSLSNDVPMLSFSLSSKIFTIVALHLGHIHSITLVSDHHTFGPKGFVPTSFKDHLLLLYHDHHHPHHHRRHHHHFGTHLTTIEQHFKHAIITIILTAVLGHTEQ